MSVEVTDWYQLKALGSSKYHAAVNEGKVEKQNCARQFRPHGVTLFVNRRRICNAFLCICLCIHVFVIGLFEIHTEIAAYWSAGLADWRRH